MELNLPKRINEGLAKIIYNTPPNSKFVKSYKDLIGGYLEIKSETLNVYDKTKSYYIATNLEIPETIKIIRYHQRIEELYSKQLNDIHKGTFALLNFVIRQMKHFDVSIGAFRYMSEEYNRNYKFLRAQMFDLEDICPEYCEKRYCVDLDAIIRIIRKKVKDTELANSIITQIENL